MLTPPCLGPQAHFHSNYCFFFFHILVSIFYVSVYQCVIVFLNPSIFFFKCISSSGKIHINALVQKLDELDIDENARNRIKIFLNQKVKIGNICDEDLEKLGVLESKLAGEVTKVRHIPTKLIMARKLIYLELKPATIKQILYELELLHQCNHPNIVAFYRAYQTDGGISICMEYMDGGSLDLILKRAGRISEAILAKITVAVLKGLTYLCDRHSIMYGDVKPTNVLVNSSGEIKICDFGISDQLLIALTNAFVKEDTRSYASVSIRTFRIQQNVSEISIISTTTKIFNFLLNSQRRYKEAMIQPNRTYGRSVYR